MFTNIELISNLKQSSSEAFCHQKFAVHASMSVHLSLLQGSQTCKYASTQRLKTVVLFTRSHSFFTWGVLETCVLVNVLSITNMGCIRQRKKTRKTIVTVIVFY